MIFSSDIALLKGLFFTSDISVEKIPTSKRATCVLAFSKQTCPLLYRTDSHCQKNIIKNCNIIAKGKRQSFCSILFNVVCWYSETELLMFHYHPLQVWRQLWVIYSGRVTTVFIAWTAKARPPLPEKTVIHLYCFFLPSLVIREYFCVSFLVAIVSLLKTFYIQD